MIRQWGECCSVNIAISFLWTRDDIVPSFCHPYLASNNVSRDLLAICCGIRRTASCDSPLPLWLQPHNGLSRIGCLMPSLPTSIATWVRLRLSDSQCRRVHVRFLASRSGDLIRSFYQSGVVLINLVISMQNCGVCLRRQQYENMVRRYL